MVPREPVWFHRSPCGSTGACVVPQEPAWFHESNTGHARWRVAPKEPVWLQRSLCGSKGACVIPQRSRTNGAGAGPNRPVQRPRRRSKGARPKEPEPVHRSKEAGQKEPVPIEARATCSEAHARRRKVPQTLNPKP